MKWAEETYFSLRRGKLWPILEQRITQGSLSPFSLDTLLCSPLPRSSAMLLRALDRKKASQPLGSYEWSGIICWHKNPVRQVNMTLFLLLTLFISSSVQSLSHIQLSATRGLQHTRFPCPSPTPEAYSDSCPSGQWCHPTISFSVIPFSSYLKSSLASGSFQMS